MGKGTSKKKPAYGGPRRIRRMSSHQESPAASQRLLSKLALQTVQRRAKKKAKEMSKTLCHTCLPTALATTKNPPNARNQKEHSRVTFIMIIIMILYDIKIYNLKKKTLQCFSLFITNLVSIESVDSCSSYSVSSQEHSTEYKPWEDCQGTQPYLFET